ncbi:uncharacterized protein LOC123653728 [Melitaea cinxia]|uniref:uncharacterized protein LOC123653728 n=1 Tax=Melitaea cinxia TaxID=113334 RepID=UPI001E272D78|nr:uncharacterized protein LOC123653728 [Melitaea cinxia]
MATETEQAISILENTALLLKKTQLNLSKCPKQRLAKVGYLQTRIKTIEEYWMIFKEAHKKLLTCTTREERGLLPYFENEEFFIQEDLYLYMLGDLKDMLAAVESAKSKQSPPEDLQNKKVPLPVIHLPLFSGEYELWPSFKDLFSSLVHNCSALSDVEKLHYLKTSVAGEAATLLKHITVTSANYIQAWGTLNHRYRNKRLIVNALLKRLFAQKKCTSQAATQLKSLLDTTNEVLQSLENLEVSTDSWDPRTCRLGGICNERGHTTALKALIDSGSQACFISEKATQILKLHKTAVDLIVSGLESMKVRVRHEVNVNVLSRWKNFILPIKAYVMKKPLTSNIHSGTIIKRDWPHLAGIQLGDETFSASCNIDLLLGVNEYVNITKKGLIKGPPEDLLKTIWEVDEDTKRNLTQREQLCEDIYTKTQKRDECGRYVVKLPFNTEEPKSKEGNTRDIAMKRLMQLERRFNQNKELKHEYKKVIEDYIDLNHIEEIPTEEINNRSVYLPHHAVIRNDKETTKTRVVFDASCKGSNGVSLNDELLTGPVLQDDLRNLIMRWRTHAVCFVADIQKMYRMIWVDREDADYQRILWRNDQSEEVKDYRLLTVTFGTAFAPYLAVRTLMKLAEDEGDRYPEAAKILREDFYVDDAMSGSDSLQQAIKNSKDLRALLHLGGFELNKWSSNSREFLETVDPGERSSNANLELKIDGIIKALGVQWNLGKDRFEYKLNLPSISEVITKRSILSDIQKLFDPLGWIAPSIALTKILMQELWLERINWDDALNSKIASRWITLRSDLEHVNGIYIERWVDGTNKTTLIAARTRVAPLKTISLPRLELCGALILSRLLKQVGQAMRIPATQIYAWTDSSIVLSWLFGDPNNWKVFVANRVVEVTTNVSCSQWHHVQTQDNPADVGSRGMLVENLKKCELWWHGPDWLQQSKIQFTKPNIMQTEIERKNNKIQNLKITYNRNEQEKRLLTQFEEFDTLLELLRTITYCRRFLKQKTLKDRIDSKITTEELHVSMQTCIKRAQEEEFTEDIKSLKTKKRVKKTSKLKALDSYLDEDGILKVGGRLRNSELANEVKHPIILGHASRLTYLVVAEAHLKTLHGGVQLMLTYLQSKYWILRAKSLVKQCIHRWRA